LKVNLLEEDKPNLSTKSSALQWVYGVCKGLSFIKNCKGCPEKVLLQYLQRLTGCVKLHYTESKNSTGFAGLNNFSFKIENG